MRWFDKLRVRTRSLVRRGRVERELDAELRFHIEQEVEQNIRAGMTEEESRRLALRTTGSLVHIREDCRESLGLRLLDELRQDLRYAVRSFLSTPGLLIVAILTLALAVGGTAAIFSAVNAVLLRPLPFPNPKQLVNIRELDLQNGGSSLVSSGDFLDWQPRVRSFQAAAAWRFAYFNVLGRDQPEQVQGLSVSPRFLALLGAAAQEGTLFTDDRDQAGRDHVVIISDALWHRRFGALPDIVGQTIRLGEEPYTIIGILPPTFHFFQILNRPIDLYVPLVLDVAPQDRTNHDLNVYARLKPGVSVTQAQAEMDALYRNLARRYPETNASLGVRLLSMPGTFARGSRPVLLLLMAAVSLVFVIACANVTSLLLGRAVAREREMAIRVALGAGRGRLIRQLVTEGIVFGVASGAVGIAAAGWGARLLNRVVPFDVVSRMREFRLDGRVLGLALLLSIACGAGCGLTAVLALHRDPSSGARIDSGAWVKSARLTRRTGRFFVGGQIALAVVVSSGALLLIASATTLLGMPRGLNLHRVLTMQIWLPRQSYPDGQRVATFFDRVLENVEQIPGVESASVINFLPLAAQDTSVALHIDGPANSPAGEPIRARYSVIDPKYFRTIQTPVLIGRAFRDTDADESRGVAIVSASMAQRFWPNDSPIGHQIQPQFRGLQNFWDAAFGNQALTIVGVVGDIRDDGPALEGRDDVPLFYIPYRQNPAWLMHLVIRTRADPFDAAPAVRRAIWAVDQNQPIFDTKTMEDVAAETFDRPRVMASFTGAFASAAVLLAALGVYGLVTYLVGQRTREIAIRIALGAQREDVLQEFFLEGGSLGLVGVGVGLVTSIGVTRFLRSFLFGIGPTDPLTLAAVSMLLLGITLAACLIPAYRATRVDPILALRCE